MKTIANIQAFNRAIAQTPILARYINYYIISGMPT